MFTNGIHSNIIPVSSGVVQGSVLGPILFLAYINDLSEQVRSIVRLFADNKALYLCISNMSEANTLQEDLCKLGLWEEVWDMNFNPTKCQVLHVTRLKTPIPSKYFLYSIELDIFTSEGFVVSTFRQTLRLTTLKIYY